MGEKCICFFRVFFLYRKPYIPVVSVRFSLIFIVVVVCQYSHMLIINIKTNYYQTKIFFIHLTSYNVILINFKQKINIHIKLMNQV